MGHTRARKHWNVVRFWQVWFFCIIKYINGLHSLVTSTWTVNSISISRRWGQGCKWKYIGINSWTVYWSIKIVLSWRTRRSIDYHRVWISILFYYMKIWFKLNMTCHWIDYSVICIGCPSEEKMIFKSPLPNILEM